MYLIAVFFLEYAARFLDEGGIKVIATEMYVAIDYYDVEDIALDLPVW